MVHIKYFQILKLFLGDYTREIHGRGLLGVVDLRQKNIALTLAELEQRAILRSRRQGNIKLYSLNLENTEIRDIIKITEVENKVTFLAKKRDLAYIFRSDQRIVGIFGSYAKGVEKKESDVDVFIIGNSRTEEYSKKGKEFNRDISIKWFSNKQFRSLIKQKNPLVREIIQHHILLFGVEPFVEMLWSEYYGFD